MISAERRKIRVALLSVLSNTTLIAMKLIVGLAIGSVSVISEAIHSGVDLLAAVIAFISVRESSKPADADHPFGHGKIENISGTVEALLIFLAAGWIIYEAVHKLIRPEPLQTAFPGVAVMLLSALINVVVSQKLFQVGRETDSIALQADAWHLRTDVYTSAGVMAGLFLLGLGQAYFPQYYFAWLDPVCALVVAGLILRAAYHLTAQSARDLLDASLPEEEAWIRSLLEDHRPTVHGYHFLKTRKSGHMRFVEFHIQVDGEMTVRESHRFAQQLSHLIKERFRNTTVTIHVEPCTGKCIAKCRAGCLLTEDERAEIKKKLGVS